MHTNFAFCNISVLRRHGQNRSLCRAKFRLTVWVVKVSTLASLIVERRVKKKLQRGRRKEECALPRSVGQGEEREKVLWAMAFSPKAGLVAQRRQNLLLVWFPKWWKKKEQPATRQINTDNPHRDDAMGKKIILVQVAVGISVTTWDAELHWHTKTNFPSSPERLRCSLFIYFFRSVRKECLKEKGKRENRGRFS